MNSFKDRNQKVCLCNGRDILSWPPTPTSTDSEGAATLNQFIFKVLAGNTECSFVFKVHQNSTTSSSRESKPGVADSADPQPSRPTPAEGAEMAPATELEMEGTPLLSGPPRLYS